VGLVFIGPVEIMPGAFGKFERSTNRLAEELEKWQRWLDLLIQTSTDPAVVEMAEHLLYIGRKS
jgi:hypothetical protein